MISKQKKVLIVCFNELERDPRVRRQVEALKDQFFIITAGFSPTGEEDKFISLKYTGEQNRHWRYPWLLRKLVSFYLRVKKAVPLIPKRTRYDWAYWNVETKWHFKQVAQETTDLIICNDLAPLPLSYRLANQINARLVFDAHEYYPREFEGNSDWVKEVQPWYMYVCRKYLQKVDYITVVSETIGREYQKNFGVNYEVIDNKTEFQASLKPTHVDARRIKLVHHGLANEERGLDAIIDAFNLLPPYYELHFILIINKFNQDYFSRLKEKAGTSSRIFFHKPVPFYEIPEFINQYDIGLNYFHTSNFSVLATVPNKFYEFLQARLAIVAGPSFEMPKVIRKYELGSFTDELSAGSLASAILSLSPEKIYLCKNNSHRLAYELSADSNKKLIKQIATRLCDVRNVN